MVDRTAEEGFCEKTGIVRSLCEHCLAERPRMLLESAEGRLSPEEEHARLMQMLERGLGNSRQQVYDGNVTVTVESRRPKAPASGRIFYVMITRTLKIGHYVRPTRDGRLLGMSNHLSWERLSRAELSRLKVNIIWALRRKKIRQGESTVYLHGPAPEHVWLTQEERDLFDQLNREAMKGTAEKLQKPRRKTP